MRDVLLLFPTMHKNAKKAVTSIFSFRFLHHFCMDFNATKARLIKYLSSNVYDIFIGSIVSEILTKIGTF